MATITVLRDISTAPTADRDPEVSSNERGGLVHPIARATRLLFASSIPHVLDSQEPEWHVKVTSR